MTAVPVPPPQHRVAKAVASALRKAKPSEYGHVEAAGEGLPYVRVTRSGVDRAVMLVDRLLTSAEAAGFRYVKRAFVVSAERVGFHLEEWTERHPITGGKKPVGFVVGNYEMVPSGRFRLQLVGSAGNTRSFKDDRRRRIEDQIPAAVLAISEVAERSIAVAEEREAKRREVERSLARSEEVRRQRAEEEVRTARVRKLVGEWAEAETIRQFVAAVRAESSRRGCDGSDAIAAWLEQAERTADCIDPLKQADLAETLRLPSSPLPPTDWLKRLIGGG